MKYFKLTKSDSILSLIKKVRNKKIIISILVFIIINIIIIALFNWQNINVLTIEMKAKNETPISICYDNGKDGDPFDINHVERVITSGNSETKKIRVIFKAKDVKNLRIDIEDSGVYEIKDVSLISSPFIEKNIQGINLLDNFKVPVNVNNNYDGKNLVLNINQGHASILGLNLEWNSMFNTKIVILEIIMFLLIILILQSKNIYMKLIDNKLLCKSSTKSNSEKKYIKAIKTIIGVTIFSVIFEGIIIRIISILSSNICSNSNITLYFKMASNWSWSRFYLWMIIFQIIGICYAIGINKSFKYRYLIAMIVLILLTIGKFHGSSIGSYDIMLKGNTTNYNQTTILGNPQPIRGDEWATVKPYYMAQYAEGFPYFNTNLGFDDGMDMVISGFAPIKDITVLARPDIWPFLFLEKTYAFSFNWCFRLILLFMSSLEFIYILTKEKKIALAGALIIIFSPPIQWMLSQSMTLMIISAQYAVVLFCKYITTTKRYKRYLCLAGVAWCALIYILTLYPAIQVPMGYLFLSIMVYFLYVYKEYKPFALWRMGQYIIAFLPIIFILINFFIKSRPAMNIMINTTYPGKIREWLEFPYEYHIYDLLNLFTQFKQPAFSNASEISSFFTMLPFSIIACIYVFIKTDKKAKLPFIIGIVSMGLFIYALLPEIPLLNKITLLSYSYPSRINYVSGLGFIYMILAMLPYTKQMDNELICKNKALIYTLIIATTLFILTINSENVSMYFDNLIGGPIFLVIIISIICLLGFFLITISKKNTNKFMFLFALLTISSTLLVNPICQGTDAMFEKTTMKKVRELNQDNKGRWMVNGNTAIANLVTAQGVARTSGTYYCPDLKMMEIIDPDKEYYDMYNAFSYVNMKLTDKEMSMTKKDKSVTVNILLPLEIAKKLDIKYILTGEEVPKKFIEDGSVELLYKDDVDDWKIYKII